MANSELVALLDIGSNAIRCVVAQLDGRPGVEIALRQRVQTRLGDSSSGQLPTAGIDATLRAARRFLKKVRRKHGGARVLAVATAAVRDAQNRDALLEPLAALGVRDVRILSGSEEGRLGAEAALRALPIELGIVVDVGGGSLQVTSVRDGAIGESRSAPLGVVRSSARFIEHDPPTPGELAALRAELRPRLAELLVAAPRDGVVLAAGGIANALGRLALARREDYARLARRGERTELARLTHGLELGRAELEAVRAMLEPMPLAERALAPGLKPERADVIVTGAVVFEELLAASGFEALTVSRTSVRDAVLWREAQNLTRC